eukprot:SAG11_NODE_20216_length_450_cov_0.874644_2_plen_45_part_01
MRLREERRMQISAVVSTDGCDPATFATEVARVDEACCDGGAEICA